MPKVLLVGWDGAGWTGIHPLLDAGEMPNLARIVDNGVMGDLAPLTPLCPPLLWTSIATGQFADRHGIFDTVEPDPVTGGVRPVTRASLASPQLWDILAGENLRCQVTGWPVTHPAAGPATCVSDGFVHGAPRCVHPPAIEAMITPLRFEPQEWTGNDLSLFVPELARIDQDKDKRLAQLAVILAHAIGTHAAATALMEMDDWDFAAVWYGAAGRVTEFLAESMSGTETDALYASAVSGTYRFLDLLLGRLLALAGPNATIMVVSDRAAGEPELHASVGRGSRGMLCAAGPGIGQDEVTFGASLLDIAPTILGLFDYAPATGMHGHAISEICGKQPSKATQPSFPPARHASQSLPDPDLRELVALGYTDSIAMAARPQTEAAQLRRDFHLAQVLLAQERAAEAVPLLERLAAASQGRADIQIYLAHAYRLTEQFQACRILCEALLAEHPQSPFAPLARAHIAISEGNFAEAKGHLASARETLGIAAFLDAAIGLAYLRTENWDESAAAFRSAVAADPGMAAAHEGLARALLAGGHHEAAATAAMDAIRWRYDLPDAHAILGSALRALGREQAAGRAFAASAMLRGRIKAA